MEWLSILPNLSIGVISVLALVYVIRLYRAEQAETRTAYMAELKENRLELRALEKEVRTTLAETLSKSTVALERVSRLLEK